MLGVLLGRHGFEPLRLIVLADAVEEFDCLVALGFGFAEGEVLHALRDSHTATLIKITLDNFRREMEEGVSPNVLLLQ